jgi:hypothetical protein
VGGGGEEEEGGKSKYKTQSEHIEILFPRHHTHDATRGGPRSKAIAD